MTYIAKSHGDTLSKAESVALRRLEQRMPVPANEALATLEKRHLVESRGGEHMLTPLGRAALVKEPRAPILVGPRKAAQSLAKALASSIRAARDAGIVRSRTVDH